MGYFSNGEEGLAYEAKYCSKCIHYGDDEGPGCPIWLAHLLYNYDECNNEGSILHILIPRKGVENLQCRMFVKK